MTDLSEHQKRMIAHQLEYYKGELLGEYWKGFLIGFICGILVGGFIFLI